MCHNFCMKPPFGLRLTLHIDTRVASDEKIEILIGNERTEKIQKGSLHELYTSLQTMAVENQ